MGLTPGSNLTPKPRNDVTDPFVTEEQRKRVSLSNCMYKLCKMFFFVCVCVCVLNLFTSNNVQV